MKKTFILTALATTILSAQAQAADSNSLSTSQDFKTLNTAPAAQPATTAAPAQPAKKTTLLKGAHIVPDTTPAKPSPTTANNLKKADQGYSDISTYNVVNDQNKPVTQDWTRPKSWRIGYKNKNRTPVNE